MRKLLRMSCALVLSIGSCSVPALAQSPNSPLPTAQLSSTPFPCTGGTGGSPVTSVGTTPVQVCGPAPGGRTFIALQNFGSTNYYCTWDGSTPSITGTVNWQFPVYAGAGTQWSAPSWTPNGVINCVAASTVPMAAEATQRGVP